MGFKELLEKDQAVFFNSNELADVYTVNGKEIIAILDDDKFSKNSNEFGAFTESKLLLMKESDFNLLGKPKVNDELRINGKRYLIKSVNNKLGVTEFRLEANRS